MKLRLAFILILISLAASAQAAPTAKPAPLRVEDGRLRLELDARDGSLRTLAALPGGFNQLAVTSAPLGLWRLTLREGDTTHELSAEREAPPEVERLPAPCPGLLLVWDKLAEGGRTPLRVEVVVRLGVQPGALSRWELSVAKPKNVLIEKVQFPRVASLRPRPEETLAVPRELGALTRTPRTLAQGKGGKGARLTWRYPYGTEMSLQCLAFYQQGGPGFYAACDDTQAYRKDFALWGDGRRQMHFEIVHEPEQAAAGLSEFKLPFAALLGAFSGDWTSAAEIYRASPTARAIAGRGRLGRGLTPAWLTDTGLWLWNRGRSQEVLDPAVALRKQLKAPVSVLWHWWHNCPYDAGFPEYLPPREGTEAFKTALAAARKRDVHAILYMNQRLWGMSTRSWTAEGAAPYAVRGKTGQVTSETYNTFMKVPCAPMCIGTQYWRDKYAGLAGDVLGNLKPDGIYMDQGGVLATCFDPRHGHIVGGGRYWTDGFAMLTSEIRDRSAARGAVALGCEYGGEPWIGNYDLALGLCVSADRIGSAAAWEPIPFFQAVYHPSAVVFGDAAGLVHPPYDEKWPPEQAPAQRLTLLDRKFSAQFYLEQGRTFAWGMQPMLANFQPAQLRERPEEMDFVTRLARTRLAARKYLLQGTWLRPPALGVPKVEIDVAKAGVYTPLKASRRSYPAALAGAWRAPDGDVGIALASISGEKLELKLPIDAEGYGLPERCAVYRIDERGRHRLGVFERGKPEIQLELPPRGLCVLELHVG